jgi:chemotaxis protein MotB
MPTLRPLALGFATLAILAFAGCGGEREIGYQQVEIDEYKRQIRELEDQLYKKDEGVVAKRTEATDGSNSINNLNKIVDPNTSVSGRPVEVVFSVDSNVLFKSGSATLSGEAKSSLNKVVAVIKNQFAGYDVRIIGYTDDQKVSRSKDNWDDNWELSAGRARQVLLYLEGRGIEEKRLGLAGYGDVRPLVPNTSASNRQKNRRVEVVVIPPGAGVPSK